MATQDRSCFYHSTSDLEINCCFLHKDTASITAHLTLRSTVAFSTKILAWHCDIGATSAEQQHCAHLRARPVKLQGYLLPQVLQILDHTLLDCSLPSLVYKSLLEADLRHRMSGHLMHLKALWTFATLLLRERAIFHICVIGKYGTMWVRMRTVQTHQCYVRISVGKSSKLKEECTPEVTSQIIESCLLECSSN